jgi:hypothetical protein
VPRVPIRFRYVSKASHQRGSLVTLFPLQYHVNPEFR